MRRFRGWMAAAAILVLWGLTSLAGAVTLDEFFQQRPDIPDNISKWSGNHDKVWILREWIKITTERNEDYETARRILADLEKGTATPPSSPTVPGPGGSPTAPSGPSAGALEKLGVRVIRCGVDGPHWRLVDIQWQDEQAAGGRHHIYVETQDEGGGRQTGVEVTFFWADGEAKARTEDKPAPELGANFPMVNAGNCYGARVSDGLPSDRVEGMGLGTPEQPAFTIHTCFLLTFRKESRQAPPDETPPAPNPGNEPSDGFTPPPGSPAPGDPPAPAPGSNDDGAAAPPAASSDSESGNLAGVHWYSGDKDMIGDRGGWNVETVCGLDQGGQIDTAMQNARRAKEHGLTNIIRLDWRGGCPVPKDSAQFQEYGDRFIDLVKQFSGVARHFIVGNEPNIESFINAQRYAAAFTYIYNRKKEMPAGILLLACCSATFSPNVNAEGKFADGTYLDWMADMCSRISQVDGFAIHAYGDPTQGNADPRQPCNRNNWPFDGGFQSFRDQAKVIAKKWGDSKPLYITECNTDTNGLDAPNPVDTYQSGWLLKAYEAVRAYNADRGGLPPVRALCWFVDRDDGQWASFSLRKIPKARDDMRAAFHDPANR